MGCLIYLREHRGNNLSLWSVVSATKEHEKKDGEYTDLLKGSPFLNS
jgi:hypothetical protein